MVECNHDCCVFRMRCRDTPWVAVAGEFNAWATDTHRMTKVAEHEWEVRIRLSPGTYRFRYVACGGRWLIDEAAHGVVANGRGDWDSLINVPGH